MSRLIVYHFIYFVKYWATRVGLYLEAGIYFFFRHLVFPYSSGLPWFGLLLFRGCHVCYGVLYRLSGSTCSLHLVLVLL